MNLCQFCQKGFSSKANLDNHIKTAKYCIKLRGETDLDIITKFACTYCDTIYTSNRNLSIHLVTCKNKKVVEKYEMIIEKLQLKHCQEIVTLKNTIDSLGKTITYFDKNIDEWERYCDNIEEHLETTKKQLENTEKQLEIEKGNVIKLTRELDTRKGEINIYKKQKPQITNNTNNIGAVTVNNIKKLKMVKTDNIQTIEKRVLELIETYTYDLFLEGPNGLIKFLINCATLEVEGVDGDIITERNLVCTDVSRDSFYMLIEDKKKGVKVWVLDSRKEAINKVFDFIKDKIFDYYDKLKDAFVKPPPRLSLLELRDIRNKIEKEKKKEELEFKKCKARGIEYKPRIITNDPEKEHSEHLIHVNEQNISNWGGKDGEEAHDNYMGKIRSCKKLVDGAQSEYIKDSDRYKLVDDLAKGIKKELSI